MKNSNNNSINCHELFHNDHTVMILINPKTGEIIDANSAAINFYGYEREELVHMNIYK